MFKIKCDIVVNEDIGTEILFRSSSRAVIYLTIAVFKNGVIIESLKTNVKSTTISHNCIFTGLQDCSLI